MAVKKSTAPKGKKVTLKLAKEALKVTADGYRRVDLSNLGIATFPKCLLKLTDVDELDLSRNLLQKLPEYVGNMTTLSRLDLHSNKLEALPESLGQLVGLTHLNVSNNRLRSGGLPASLCSLTQLRSLNLGMNLLDRLPHGLAALTALQDVGLFDNYFTELPKFLLAIRRLNVKRNPCSSGRVGDGAGGGAAPATRAKVLYLAPESSLCKACLHQCQQERDHNKRNAGGDGRGVSVEKRNRSYAGLYTPNSVAAANQEWRMRR